MLVAGVDVSFVSKNETRAVAALVVCAMDGTVVCTRTQWVRLEAEYRSGYLAEREATPLIGLIERLRRECPRFIPDVVLVDGNGVMHPRRWGLACEIGKRTGLVTIGVAKKLMNFCGDEKIVRSQCTYHSPVDIVVENELLGRAVVTTRASQRPVYVSVGFGVDLNRAVDIVKQCSRHRIPEPIRQADLISRDVIRSIALNPIPTPPIALDPIHTITLTDPDLDSTRSHPLDPAESTVGSDSCHVEHTIDAPCSPPHDEANPIPLLRPMFFPDATCPKD